MGGGEQSETAKERTHRHTQLHLPQALFCDYGQGKNYFIFTLMLSTEHNNQYTVAAQYIVLDELMLF